jgi:BirA family biotin operon repressor/biotin-[acetyl-CoA-carboxylase] ligase
MIKWSFNEFAEVDSTQNVLRNLGRYGVNEGAVVVAKRQTAGRGRQGRQWDSPEGGLYMSLLFRPTSAANLQTLTVASSLAVVRGIEKATGLKTRIRWPNDVMVGGKKVAGVIAESSFTGEGLSFVMVGIGVNCNAKVTTVEPTNAATSLSEELGKEADIKELRQAILDAMGSIYDQRLGGADTMKLARGAIGTLGKRVEVKTKSGKTIEGMAIDVEPAGGLVLEQAEGKLTLRAEDVERLREV